MEVSGTDGSVYYEDVNLLVVAGDEIHVCVDGTHYVGDGTADTVVESDLFYQGTPEVSVFRVAGIDENANSSDLGVEIEYVYDAVDTTADSHTDQVSLDALTGEQANVAMGDSGPPVMLKRT